MSGTSSATARFVDAIRRGGVLGELLGRPPRAGDQLTAAVRTASVEKCVRAGTAKGAFEGADDGVLRLGWQIAVAAFTVRAKLKHCPSPGCTWLRTSESARERWLSAVAGASSSGRVGLECRA